MWIPCAILRDFDRIHSKIQKIRTLQFMSTDFTDKLRIWYQKNARDLPWRNTRNPYHIWLSEVILQQTRVNQGMPYYEKFVHEFPELADLASASEERVLKLWQGLGYYSRGRNMLHTAVFIQNSLQGQFPDRYDEIVKLKGIGPYTAAAIASFAFDEIVAVVDGNVKRVISRLYQLDETIPAKQYSKIANDLISRNHPALHNQAMMELGSLVCTPTNPKCDICPIFEHCLSATQKTQHLFPVKVKKPQKQKKFFYYIVVISDGLTWIYQRPAGEIWTGLWEFPLIQSNHPLQQKSLNDSILALFPNWEQIPIPSAKWYQKHLLTHLEIHAEFIVFQDFNVLPEYYGSGKLVAIDKINTKFALSRLTEKFIESKTMSTYVSQ